MSDTGVVRTKKLLVNPLLQRKQMVVEVIHTGRAALNRNEVRDAVAKMFKIKTARLVVIYGLETVYGGGRSTGFALIYDNEKALEQFEPKYRLIRNGTGTRVSFSRKQKKEKKNRMKKVRGTKKTAAGAGKKAAKE
eukprot:TRINITY_DN1537_c0_g1_i1.p1 TRINITY_DN1537_c0_g1~~TRINITY_DN1537_c0_g1_i1.p1  ORF type:complete len:149 (-),score=49.41 TRINITY_DN1537_c0_g1_i1:151-558(-)